jgi:OMF family outer membrane factor
MFRIGVIFFFLLASPLLKGQSLTFGSLDALLRYADTASYLNDQTKLQQNLAELTTKAAFGNALNPRIPVSGAMTNNTNLAVNFIPAEIFGGPAGTFREVTFGQQYITSLNIAPQFDIINVAHIAEIKSAKINEELVETQNKISKKNLFDQLNAVYNNILSFEAQIAVLEENTLKADSIFIIVKNKYDEGIIRIQDLNDAEVNLIQHKNKLNQAKLSLEQQYLSLAILCDTKEAIQLSEKLWDVKPSNETLAVTGNISLKSYMLQRAAAEQEYKVAKLQNLPTLSFVSSFNRQNNSNIKYFDDGQRWINSSYVGLRLSWDFPTNVAKLTTMRSAKINLQLSQMSVDHATLQSDLQDRQLENDFTKAQADYQSALAVYSLESVSYNHVMNQYVNDIIPLDRLLTAQVKLLSSRLNVASALATLSYTGSKIQINNQFK